MSRSAAGPHARRGLVGFASFLRERFLLLRFVSELRIQAQRFLEGGLFGIVVLKTELFIAAVSPLLGIHRSGWAARKRRHGWAAGKRAHLRVRRRSQTGFY